MRFLAQKRGLILHRTSLIFHQINKTKYTPVISLTLKPSILWSSPLKIINCYQNIQTELGYKFSHMGRIKELVM